MEITTTGTKILKTLFKDLSRKSTVTSISKETGMTRVGAWKVLKKLEAEKIISLEGINKGKTSTDIISINYEPSLAKKILALILAEESSKNLRWVNTFSEINAEFGLIYGSMLKNQKEANDIDIVIVANKKRFIEIDKTITKIQKTQAKKIHSILFTKEEFKKELKKNPAFIDAVKNGVVLFGHENYVDFVSEV